MDAISIYKAQIYSVNSFKEMIQKYEDNDPEILKIFKEESLVLKGMEQILMAIGLDCNQYRRSCE